MQFLSLLHTPKFAITGVNATVEMCVCLLSQVLLNKLFK